MKTIKTVAVVAVLVAIWFVGFFTVVYYANANAAAKGPTALERGIMAAQESASNESFLKK
jgi:hypothetical protein